MKNLGSKINTRWVVLILIALVAIGVYLGSSKQSSHLVSPSLWSSAQQNEFIQFCTNPKENNLSIQSCTCMQHYFQSKYSADQYKQLLKKYSGKTNVQPLIESEKFCGVTVSNSFLFTSTSKPIAAPTITIPVTFQSYTHDAQNITENAYRFYFTYPTNWTINYEKNEADYIKKANLTRIEFDFAPPGWNIPSQSVGFMGYQVMSVDIHPHFDTIDSYIKSEYDQFAQGKIEGVTDTSIGNRTSYLVRAKTDSNPVFQSGWARRNVVLGSKYSYEISHGNGGSGGADGWTLIEETIWPLLHFD